MKDEKFASPYLPNRVADGVSVPMPKPDFDFEGAVSGFDYTDPDIYASSLNNPSLDPDFLGGYGGSAEGIYDNQYSLGGNILDRLLDDQADTITPSAVTDSTKLKEELKQKEREATDEPTGTTSTIKESFGLGALKITPEVVAVLLAFALGYLLPQILKR